MGEKIHFWADIKDDFRPSSETLADEHAGEDEGLSVRLTSLADLQSELQFLKVEGRKVDLMDFHTHGNKGSIALGAESLNVNNVALRLNNKGFDRIFNQDASINFDGCNVGQGYQGEFFLALVGRILLVSSGGKVMGNTGVGIGMPFLVKVGYLSPLGIAGALIPISKGEGPHPLGSWVTAHVGIGGSVRLENHSYLIPEKIKERIRDGESRFAKMDVTHTYFMATKQHLLAAKDMVSQENMTPSFRRMFNACIYLQKLENNLYAAEVAERHFR